MKVLLSIKPEFVNEIFGGSKKYEYRKIIFKNQNISSVVVYATMPVGKVVGEFDIGSIIEASPEVLWNKTKKHSGISYEFFSDYFSKKAKGYAIQIENARLFPEPMSINDFDQSIKVAPQSFCYTF